MVAAEITPTTVQKVYVHSTAMTGTPLRLIKYVFYGTKATDADWIVTATYFQAGTPLFWNACVIDSSTNGVVEASTGCTYTSSGTTLTFSGGTTGTVYGEIWYSVT